MQGHAGFLSSTISGRLTWGVGLDLGISGELM